MAARLWLLVLLFAGTPIFGSQSFQNFGPFMLDSNGPGELTSSTFQIPVTTSGLLALRYQAPAVHCSPILVHVFVDQREAASMGPVAAKESSDFLELGPLAPGDHEVTLRGEGVVGGCNPGRVTAWGGLGTVWTSADPSEASVDLGEVIFESEFVNYAWGYAFKGNVISSDGRTFSYFLSAARLRALPELKEGQELAGHWLTAKYETERHELGSVSPQEMEHARELALALRKLPALPTVLRTVAIDSGEATYAIWIRSADDRYRRIVLANRGDRAGELDYPQATELREWLMKLRPHAKVLAPQMGSAGPRS